MKPLRVLFIFILVSNSLLLLPQAGPVNIDLRNDGNKLDAKFYPAGKPDRVPSVILLHGFPGNQLGPLGLAERLNAAGMNVLVFNYEGSYQSEGTFSFDNCIENTGTAVNFLIEPGNQKKFNIDTSKIFVCGYSFGGTIAIESAMYNNKIKNIVSIANDDHSVSIRKAAADPEFREKYQQFIGKSFEPSGPFRGDIKTQMDYCINNADRYDLVKNADKLIQKKVLLIFGWKDKTSLIEVNTLPLYRKLQQLNAINISIRGFESDHRFANVMDDVTSTIIAWITENTKY